MPARISKTLSQGQYEIFVDFAYRQIDRQRDALSMPARISKTLSQNSDRYHCD
jgi:hypothetical protein